MLDPNKIESINVLKGEKATTKYGDSGKTVVVQINTKSGIINTDHHFDITTIQGYGNTPDPLIILDGKEISKETCNP